MKRFIIVLAIDQESEEALRATVKLAGDNAVVQSVLEVGLKDYLIPDIASFVRSCVARGIFWVQ